MKVLVFIAFHLLGLDGDFVCLYGGVYTYTCMHPQQQRRDSDVSLFHPLPYSLEKGSLTEPGACCFVVVIVVVVVVVVVIVVVDNDDDTVVFPLD